MTRSSRQFRGGSSPVRARRKSSWEEGPGGSAAVAVASSTSVIIGLGAQLLQDGTTLVRTRGLLHAWLVSVSAANEGFRGAFGIGIVRDQAFAVGVTAVPTPITDQGWDGWLFWMPFFIEAPATMATFGNAGSAVVDMPIDTKAMRKLDLGDTIYGVLEVTENGTAVANVHFDSRVLLKLP